MIFSACLLPLLAILTTTGVSGTPLAHGEPDYDNQCYVDNKFYDVGEVWELDEVCGRGSCSRLGSTDKFIIRKKYCGEYEPEDIESHCRLVEKPRHLPFPSCCAEIECDELPTQKPTPFTAFNKKLSAEYKKKVEASKYYN